MSRFLKEGLLPSSSNAESQAAASSMVSARSRLMAMVLEAIRKAGAAGMTCDEVEVSTGLPHQTASARVFDLRERALIIDSGQRRKTRSGRKAAVWVVKS